MSSDSRVTVVEIQDVIPHPNADALDIAFPFESYPVIVRKGEYKVGDPAVYVPVDMCVPVAAERFAFLAARGHVDGQHRVRAIRLRGTYSEGLLVPVLPGEEVGMDVTEQIGATKWEPVEQSLATGGMSEGGPSGYVTYTDVENLRKHRRAVAEAAAPFVVSEKIHGANGRFVHTEDRLWCGSRTQWKTPDETNMWWRCARVADLEEKLKQIPGIMIFGEVYGQVQDLRYQEKLNFIAFDAWGRRPDGTMGYFDYADFVKVTDQVGIPRVPVLATIDAWMDDTFPMLAELAEGKTILGAGAHVREGVVIRPTKEQWNPRLGRVIAKLIGEGYRLRKEKS